MTEQLDDWEGRLAAMASGVRYKPPVVKRLRRSPLIGKPSTAPSKPDPQAFLDESCPCDECNLRRLCAAGELACERYSMFMQGQSPEKWRQVPATPTKERFDLYLAASAD